MQLLLLLLCLPALAFADTRSVPLLPVGPDYAQGNLSAVAPNSAPYSTAGDERIEIFTHAWVAPAAGTDIVLRWHNCLWLTLNSSNQYRLTSNCDGSQSSSAVIDASVFSGAVTLRLQRDMTARLIKLEGWSANFSVYRSATDSFGTGIPDTNTRVGTLYVGTDNYSAGTNSGEVGYINWYSTLIALGQTNYPDQFVLGDLGAWAFNNSLADASENTLAFTAATSITYGDTPTYAPFAFAGDTETAYVGQANALHGLCIPLNGTSSVTYAWTQLAGPNTLTLSSSAVAAPTFSNHAETLSGKVSYQMQLECIDSDMDSTTSTAKVGVVPLDGYDNIDYAGLFDPAFARIIKPLPRVVPWSNFEVNDALIARNIGAAASADTPAAGSLVYSGNISFASDFPAFVVNCSSTCTGTGLLESGNFYLMPWDSVSGAGQGYYTVYVSSIISPTSFMQASYTPSELLCTLPCSNIGTAFYASKADSGTFDWGWFGARTSSASNSYSYYDFLLSIYRRWLRTGDDSYYTYADTFCDNWFKWGLGEGTSKPGPRVRSLGGIYACAALEGHTSWLAPIQAVQTGYWTSTGIIFKDGSGAYPAAFTDYREAGYQLRDAAIGSYIDSNAGRKAAYCAFVSDQVDQFAGGLVSIDADHAFPNEDEFSLNSDYPFKGQGNAGWRVDIPMQGLLEAYVTNTTADGCNDSGVAAQALEAFRLILNWLRDYAIKDYTSVDGGTGTVKATFADVGYETNGHGSYGTGTVSGTNGSPTITGSALATFTSEAACSATPKGWIGLTGPTQAAHVQAIYRIASCGSDTSLTLTTNFSGTDFSGSVASFVPYANAALTDCGSSLATNCNDDPYSVTNLSKLLPMIFGWYAYKVGDSSYITVGDALFGAGFGGPADGGNGLEACDGPVCTNDQSFWATSLPACNTNPRPCYAGGGMFSGDGPLGKNYNQGSGAAGGAAYVGYRNLLGVPLYSGSSLSNSRFSNSVFK